MVARSKEEHRRSVDWYRRLADDVAYRKTVRQLEDIGDALSNIFMAVRRELAAPIDTSMIGHFPEVPKQLPPPPPKRKK